MAQVYYWLGFVVFWLLTTAIIGGLLVAMWRARWFGPTKRRLANAKLGASIIYWGRPFIRSRGSCELIVGFSRRGGYWGADWWERDLAARIVRDSLRAGFPYNDD